ncbi:hypothetical protein C0J52_27921 [Blattella germanica]|nr:hypothetical protein C0J52_27921 [Blattella germanica]
MVMFIPPAPVAQSEHTCVPRAWERLAVEKNGMEDNENKAEWPNPKENLRRSTCIKDGTRWTYRNRVTMWDFLTSKRSVGRQRTRWADTFTRKAGKQSVDRRTRSKDNVVGTAESVTRLRTITTRRKQTIEQAISDKRGISSESVIFSRMLIAYVIAIFVIYLTIQWLVHRAKNYPPGPPSIPFLGNIVFIPSKNIHFTLAGKWRQKYGPLVGLTVGSSLRAVAVCGPREVLEILKREEFQGRPKGEFFKERSFNKYLGM